MTAAAVFIVLLHFHEILQRYFFSLSVKFAAIIMLRRFMPFSPLLLLLLLSCSPPPSEQAPELRTDLPHLLRSYYLLRPDRGDFLLTYHRDSARADFLLR